MKKGAAYFGRPLPYHIVEGYFRILNYKVKNVSSPV